ncbi:major facilitator superfamily protein [Stylonychia lemnae]|uniref:Major facilitator superfamily protein n=1 Tax=Stylonychia lemnae TaxID=5949 RepID=A0A077ZNV9_STYLE|nr:major facilitator superfamily protein [Stylonychia lemnae]|eukprot:CDW71070.1 major facilitator superfamily protein [Stylonychia lemnae]
MDQSGFGKLGFYNLALVSIFCSIGGLFSTSINAKLGVNVSLFLGAIFDGLWILCSLLPTMRNQITDQEELNNSVIFSKQFIYPVMLFASCVCGLTTGLLWTSQGVYISQCATEENKGFYFGYFWTMYTLSQVFGNLIAALVIGNTNQVTYFIVMASIALASSLLFITLRKPTLQNQEQLSLSDLVIEANANQKQIQTADSGIVDLQGMSQTQNSSISNNMIQKTSEVSIYQNAMSILKFMVSPRMRYFILEIGWTGFSISYFSGMLVLIMTDSMGADESESLKSYEKALFAMVALGVGEVVGSQLVGQIVDKVNSKVAVIFNLVVLVLMLIVTFIYLIIYEFSWLAFVMTFLWGVQDAAVNTHCMEMLGFEFDDNSEAFAVFAMFQGIICFFVQLVQSLVIDRTGFIIYTSVFGIIGVISIGLTYFFDFKEKKAQDSQRVREYTLIEQKQN